MRPPLREAWLVTPGELYPLAVGRQAAIGFAVGAAAIVLAFAVVDRHRPS